MLTTPAPPLLSHSTLGGGASQDYEVYYSSGTPTSSSLLPPTFASSAQAFASSQDQQANMLGDSSLRGANVPNNEMMRERTMQLLAERQRRASLNCSPPISPASSLGSASPHRDAYPSPRPDSYPIVTVGEATNAYAGGTTTILSTGDAVTISRNAMRMPRGAVSLPVGRAGTHVSASPPMPASPQSGGQPYGYPPTPPTDACVPTGLIDDLEEMLSEASSSSSPLNDFEDGLLFEDLFEQGPATSSAPLSHPPPLISQQSVYDPTVRLTGGVAGLSPASVLGLAGHDSMTLDSTGHGGSPLGLPSPYVNGMATAAGYHFGVKKDERASKGEVYPVVALWEFLLEVLYYPCYEHILRWRNKSDGHFKIVDSQSLAKLWGLYKRKRDMNFDKMSRAMRYYYDKGILEKGGSGARLEYKFGPRSNWLDFRPPPGSKPGRFFNAQPPRRGRASRNNTANNSSNATMNLPQMMMGATSPPLRHQMHSPITYAPQRAYQNYAGIRHSPY